ncbi:MAG TPA: porin [Myxococcota bacterium]|nr:porin [Myxococcota bacterium]
MPRSLTALGAGLLLALALAPARSALCAEPADDRAALEQRVEQLERELALVRRKLEVDEETQASKDPQPVLTAGADGFSLRSPDSSSWVLRLRGYTQLDRRFFFSPSSLPPGSDTFLFRTVRPILEGTLANVVDFRLMPDFAGSQLTLQDAWANLRYLPEAQLQLGKYKGPVGLERLQNTPATWFAEPAFPTQLVPNRDLGVMLQGVFGEGTFSYQLASMNGTTDGGSDDVDTGNDKDLVGRVFAHPFQGSGIAALEGLGIGFATTYGRQAGTPGSFKTTGQETFFSFRSEVTQTGPAARYAPQAYWYFGPVGLLAEYVNSSREYRRPGFSDVRARNSAWQVSLGWALTGENESYKGLIPSASFDPLRGRFGGWELVGRVSQLKVDGSVFEANFADPASAESATLWSAGVNWYLNRVLKIAVDYDHTSFRSFADQPERKPESVLITRAQLSF